MSAPGLAWVLYDIRPNGMFVIFKIGREVKLKVFVPWRGVGSISFLGTTALPAKQGLVMASVERGHGKWVVL